MSEVLRKVSVETYKKRLESVRWDYNYLNGESYKKAKSEHDDLRFIADVQPELLPLYIAARDKAGA